MEQLNREIQPDFKTLTDLQLVHPQEYISQSGAKIYALPIQDQEMVKIDFIFKVKSTKKPLIAFSTTMMLQEGSTSLSSEEIAEKLEYLGAFLFCINHKDTSLISILCLEKNAEETIKIITDFILHPTFPEDKLAIHRAKRKERFKIDNEKVEIISQRIFYQKIFGPETPYGFYPTLKDFDSITRDDLIQFHKEHFVAENLSIIICADQKSEKFKPIIQALQSITIPNKLNTQNIDFKLEQSNQLKFLINKENALQTSINIGKTIINCTHPDYLKLEVLNTILGGYFGSRLMTNVREEKGYTYGIGSGIISLEKTGYFIITTRVKKEVTEKALEAIYEEIRLLRTEKVPAEELTIVKNFMLSELAKEFDGAIPTSEMLATTAEYNLNFEEYYKNYWNIINTITSKELRDLANKYFDEKTMYEIVVG